MQGFFGGGSEYDIQSDCTPCQKFHKCIIPCQKFLMRNSISTIRTGLQYWNFLTIRVTKSLWFIKSVTLHASFMQKIIKFPNVKIYEDLIFKTWNMLFNIWLIYASMEYHSLPEVANRCQYVGMYDIFVPLYRLYYIMKSPLHVQTFINRFC